MMIARPAFRAAARGLLAAGLLAISALAATASADPPLPLSGIGLVDFPDSICTGTLISPRQVLTAAHCMFDDDGRRIKPTRFIAGLDGDRKSGEARVIATTIPPGYDIKRFENSDEINDLDWAVVELDRSLASVAAVVPIADLSAHPIGPGSRFATVGYGAHDGEAPTVLRNCRVKLVRGASLGHQCGTVPGDSGGPDLALIEGRWQIIGTESADAEVDHIKNIGLSVTAAAFGPAIRGQTGPARAPAATAIAPQSADDSDTRDSDTRDSETRASGQEGGSAVASRPASRQRGGWWHKIVTEE